MSKLQRRRPARRTTVQAADLAHQGGTRSNVPRSDAAQVRLLVRMAADPAAPALSPQQAAELQASHGNHYVHRALSAIQRRPRPRTAVPPVPGLPASAVRLAHRRLATDPQSALDAVARALARRGEINLPFLVDGKMVYVHDTTRMAPGHYGHTSLSPGTARPRACRVEIGPDAFQSVGVLYATVMHEYQHVLQFRQPIAKGEAVDEAQARLWEVENLERTGLWRDARYMTELPGQLRHWWGRLSEEEQGALAARYSVAQESLRRLNERRLEEQFRQQRGTRGSRGRSRQASRPAVESQFEREAAVRH